MRQKCGFIGWFTDWWNKSGPETLAIFAVLLLLGGAIIFAILAYQYGNAVVATTRGENGFIEEGYPEDDENSETYDDGFDNED